MYHEVKRARLEHEETLWWKEDIALTIPISIRRTITVAAF